MWDLIVSVPDHCLSFYFLFHSQFRPLCPFQILFIPVSRSIHTSKPYPCPRHTRNIVEVNERLALPTSNHGAPDSNPVANEILSELKRRFIAHSLSCSPFHPSEMTELLLKET